MTEVENMDVTKDEVYKIAKETVEQKTEYISYLIGFITLIAIISTFIGVILLSLRIVLGSILAIYLTGQLSKFFEKCKGKLIEKLVEEYDEKGI